jgi:hypothetical protein
MYMYIISCSSVQLMQRMLYGKYAVTELKKRPATGPSTEKLAVEDIGAVSLNLPPARRILAKTAPYVLNPMQQ